MSKTTTTTPPTPTKSKDLTDQVARIFAAEKAVKKAETAANRARKSLRALRFASASPALISEASRTADLATGESEGYFDLLLERLDVLRSMTDANVSKADAEAYGFDPGKGDTNGPSLASTITAEGGSVIGKRMRTVHGF